MLYLFSAVQIGQIYFFEVREMPENVLKWSPILDDDIEIVRILGVAYDRKVFFCRSIEMACHLYEYYEDALDKAVYCDPSSGPVSNRPAVMYHSESAPSVQNAVSSYLSDPNGVVHMECLLHNSLVWGYIARMSGKLYMGNTTST